MSLSLHLCHSLTLSLPLGEREVHDADEGRLVGVPPGGRLVLQHDFPSACKHAVFRQCEAEWRGERDCVKSFRASYTGLYPQKGGCVPDADDGLLVGVPSGGRLVVQRLRVLHGPCHEYGSRGCHVHTRAIPHGGLRPVHQTSTCLHAINVRAVWYKSEHVPHKIWGSRNIRSPPCTPRNQTPRARRRDWGGRETLGGGGLFFRSEVTLWCTRWGGRETVGCGETDGDHDADLAPESSPDCLMRPDCLIEGVMTVLYTLSVLYGGPDFLIQGSWLSYTGVA